MSDVVANVSGVKVHSNKRVSSVVNSVIYFSDGSWCDVSLGQVVNNGPGYINIGQAGAGGKAEMTERGPEKFPGANALDIRNLVSEGNSRF